MALAMAAQAGHFSPVLKSVSSGVCRRIQGLKVARSQSAEVSIYKTALCLNGTTAVEDEEGSMPMNTAQSSGTGSFTTASEYPANSDTVADAVAGIVEALVQVARRTGASVEIDGEVEAYDVERLALSDHSSSSDETNSSDSSGSDLSAPHRLSAFDFNFKELREIGKGAYGHVSLATRNLRSFGFVPSDKGKLYAVKRSNFQDHIDRNRGSLYMELQNNELARMDSSCKTIDLFAFVSDYDKASTNPSWLAMPYVEGPTLMQAQLAFSWFPASFVLDVAEDLFDALEWLHAPRGMKPGMAHGDLHVCNVLVDMSRSTPVTRFPHIRILDLGLATHAYGFDSAADQEELFLKQNSDVHDAGKIIHDLAHQDLRGLGRGSRKHPASTSHCFSSLDSGACPHASDPYAPTLFNLNDAYWPLISICTFIKPLERHCSMKSMKLAHDIKMELTPYISSRRDSHFNHDNHWDSLRLLHLLCKPLPDLPPEHRAAPVPPRPLTSPLTRAKMAKQPSPPPLDEAWEMKGLQTYRARVNKRRFEGIADLPMTAALRRAKRARHAC